MNKYVCLRNFFNYDFDYTTGHMIHYWKDQIYLIQENEYMSYNIEPDDKYIIYDLNNKEMSRIGEDLFANFKLLSLLRQERMDSIFDDE